MTLVLRTVFVPSVSTVQSLDHANKKPKAASPRQRHVLVSDVLLTWEARKNKENIGTECSSPCRAEGRTAFRMSRTVSMCTLSPPLARFNAWLKKSGP